MNTRSKLRSEVFSFLAVVTLLPLCLMSQIQVKKVNLNSQLSDYEKTIWHQPEKVEFDGVKSDTLLMQNSLVVICYTTGFKQRVTSYDEQNRVTKEASFSADELLQTIVYDSNGIIDWLNVKTSSSQLWLDVPSADQQGSFASKDRNAAHTIHNVLFDAYGYANYVVRRLDTATLHFEDYHGNCSLRTVYDAKDTPTKFQSFYPSGEPESIGMIYFMEANKVSNWKEYYENGAIKREYGFSDNVPNQREGDWKWYNSNGVLERWEIYRNGSLMRVELGSIIER